MDFGKEYRNLMAGIYTKKEIDRIKHAKLAISGIGGSAGSYLLDVLVRKGFENFILAEPDSYETRNLSRQLFANILTLGKSKLESGINYIRNINPDIRCKTFPKVDLDTVEEFVKDATVVSHQAEGFSSWALTRYMCSKFRKPFVNVSRKRKDNSRTNIALNIFDYGRNNEIYSGKDVEFESFGIPAELSLKLVKMFDDGVFDRDALEEADHAHNYFKKKIRFNDLGEIYYEVGSIRDRYPEDFFKRYSDPEICLIAGALASRAITDLVIGRNTRVFEIDIFSRKNR